MPNFTPEEDSTFRDIRKELVELERDLRRAHDVPSLTDAYYALYTLHRFLEPWWKGDMEYEVARGRITKLLRDEVIPLFSTAEVRKWVTDRAITAAQEETRDWMQLEAKSGKLPTAEEADGHYKAQIQVEKDKLQEEMTRRMKLVDEDAYVRALYFALNDWLSALNSVAKKKTIYGITTVTATDKTFIPERAMKPPDQRDI